MPGAAKRSVSQLVFAHQHGLSSALGDCQLASVLGLNANLNAKPVPIWAEIGGQQMKSQAENYFFSITHCRGCWCLREKSMTCVTFVSAIS